MNIKHEIPLCMSINPLNDLSPLCLSGWVSALHIWKTARALSGRRFSQVQPKVLDWTEIWTLSQIELSNNLSIW